MQLRWLGIVVLAVLALHSASYGAGFLANPVEGAGEFGDNSPSTEAAERMVGLVGVVLLILAAVAVIAATLWLRSHPAGPWMALGIGVALLGIGLYWAVVGVAWDAGFYGVMGLLLAGLGYLAARSPLANKSRGEGN